MAKLKLDIPNIPPIPVEDIDDGEWTYIRHNYPAEYKQAQKEIKAHAEAQAAESSGEGDKADEKPVEGKSAPAKAGVTKGG